MMDAPLDTADPRLAYMAEVMEGSRKLLAQTYAGLHQVDYVAGQVQKNATVYEWEVLAAARGLLSEAIKTLVFVHDALQRAERVPGMNCWRPIETAPKDGKTIVDLWIVGPDSDVDFYSSTARKVHGQPLRHGRATCFRWEQRGSNSPAWYPIGGMSYPLPVTVTPTHWMPLPEPPG